jgi:hypothetical protein
MHTYYFLCTPTVTPPNLLTPGDKAFWSHGYGLMTPVEVTHLNNSTGDAYQLYQIRTNEGISHQVNHCELYLNRTVVPANFQGAGDPALDGIQRLTQQAHPGHTTEQILRWESMDLKLFKLSTFRKGLSYEKFDSDSPLEVLRLYDAITILTKASHSEGASFWPHIESLTPTSKFSDLCAPTTYQKSHKVNSFYVAIGECLKTFFQLFKVSQYAPAIQQVITLQSASHNHDGFIILMAILRETLPHLGSTRIDFDRLLSELVLLDSDNVYDFLMKGIKIETIIRRCRIQGSTNGLIKRVIHSLNKSTPHQVYIHPIAIAYAQHIRLFTEATPFVAHTPTSIATDLRALDAPVHAVFGSTIDTPSSSYKSILNDPVKESTAIELNSDDDDNGDYSRVAAIMNDHDLVDAIQSVHSLKAIVKKTKNRSNRSFLKNKYGDSKAPTAEQRPKCKFCHEPHLTDKCQKRGPAFWSEEHKKKVEKFNLVHGDKPTSTHEPPTKLPYPREADLSALYNKSTTKTQAVRFIDQEIKDVTDALEEDIENGTPLEELANHCLRLHNIESSNSGTSDPPNGNFHNVDSGSDISISEFVDEQVNC